MMTNYVICLFVISLSIPLWVISCELLVALLHRTSDSLESDIDSKSVTYKILMPAHNEAGIIHKTLESLIQQGIEVDNFVIVADNCTDRTAEIARDLDVRVLERFDDAQFGKGFALDYGVQYLKENDSPEILVVLDADCETTLSSVNLLVHTCMATDRPQQALYLMRNKNETSLKQRVAGFAWLVKNKVRPLAIDKLGIPVSLTGTGMAFPWPVISAINIANGNIVEDMQLGVDCTLFGAAPQLCEKSVVYSEFPEQEEAEKTQRTRWEHGHLMTIIQQVPILCKQAILRRDWRLFLLALDIAVPPIALLVFLEVCFLGILGLYALFSGYVWAFTVLFMSFLFFSIILVLTWNRYGRDYLSFKELISIPRYIFSKLSIYSSFLFQRQTAWIKTSRNKQKDD